MSELLALSVRLCTCLRLCQSPHYGCLFAILSCFGCLKTETILIIYQNFVMVVIKVLHPLSSLSLSSFIFTICPIKLMAWLSSCKNGFHCRKSSPLVGKFVTVLIIVVYWSISSYFEKELIFILSWHVCHNVRMFSLIIRLSNYLKICQCPHYFCIFVHFMLLLSCCLKTDISLIHILFIGMVEVADPYSVRKDHIFSSDVGI